jgi:hypothetical protein
LGFWGTFVVHRHEQLLWELLPDVEGLEDAELCAEQSSGGWQLTRVFAMPHALPRSFLEDVRDLTGAPVLAAAVLDSDAASVRALAPGSSGWQTWLNREKAVEYVAEAHRSDGSQEQRVEAARRHILAETEPGAQAVAAVGWAAEAGWEPSTVAEVSQLLVREETFVEDVFFALLERLGFDAKEVEEPARPSLVELLSALFGRRLDAVELAAHEPVCGERLSFPDMRDLRLHFDGQPTLTACGCGRQFALVPTGPPSRSTQVLEEAAEPLISDAVSEVLGRQLTDAASVTYRFFPDVKGIVVRFGGADLFVAAVDGRWVVERGSRVPEQLADYGVGGPEELRVNPWIAG